MDNSSGDHRDHISKKGKTRSTIDESDTIVTRKVPLLKTRDSFAEQSNSARGEKPGKKKITDLTMSSRNTDRSIDHHG
jgi:hypothetical protein